MARDSSKGAPDALRSGPRCVQPGHGKKGWAEAASCCRYDAPPHIPTRGLPTMFSPPEMAPRCTRAPVPQRRTNGPSACQRPATELQSLFRVLHYPRPGLSLRLPSHGLSQPLAAEPRGAGCIWRTLPALRAQGAAARMTAGGLSRPGNVWFACVRRLARSALGKEGALLYRCLVCAPQRKKPGFLADCAALNPGLLVFWRRGRDSNPRQGITLNTLSRRAT